MKRLGIFAITDVNCIVDDYIDFFLSELKKFLDDLIIVCISSDNCKNRVLREHTRRIYFLDEGTTYGQAYCEILLECIKNSDIYIFDEIILANDMLFGPFFSLKEMFDLMSKKECSYWGITRRETILGQDTGDKRSYIDDYFLILRRRIYTLDIFREFCIEGKHEGKIFGELLQEYFLQDAGDVYIDTEEYHQDNPADNIDYSIYLTYELIKKKKLPFLKCELFENLNGLSISFRENLRRSFDYIKENTGYNIDLIWQHILRVYNISDIRECLHLNYIISDDVHGADDFKNKKVAVVAHLFYADLMDDTLVYLRNIQEDIDLYITVANRETENKVYNYFSSIKRNNVKVLLSGDRGRDAGALLVACRKYLMQYDYLCFVHDKKTTKGGGPVTVGKSFMYHAWENTLRSSGYVSNIIRLFEENSRLGILTPPVPALGGYLTELVGNEWTCCYQKTKELAEMLSIKVPMSPQKQPYALATAFWCRPAALKPLFEYPWRYEDFPKEPLASFGTLNHAIERIIIYVAQSEGYYTAMVESTFYASLYISNLYSVVSKFFVARHEGRILPSGSSFEKFESETLKLCRFCARNKNVMIYGAGAYGKNIASKLDELQIHYDCFVVTEKKGNLDWLMEHEVKELKEIKVNVQTHGIIVALNKENQKQVKPLLEQLGFDYYLINV